jgi:uncharacterized membrane protein
MAGIGFELRKVITRGGLGNVFNAALSGIMIVAGPWLMTMLTLVVVQLFFQNLHIGHQGLFQASIVYSYALSLSLFSGMHFLFTRIVADLLWENRPGEAAAWLLRFMAGTALAAALLSGLPVFLMPIPGISHPLLYRTACVALFMAINLLWVLMMFISLLKWYVRIMVVYALGMLTGSLLVLWWGGLWGVAGALLGFAAGHLLIVGALLALSLWAHPPLAGPSAAGLIRRYLRQYWPLILSGFCFYLGQWADKFYFWNSRGDAVEGSWFRLFGAYDLPVYLGGLSIIPGMAYFVIMSETAFYHSLQKFLHALVRAPYAGIQVAKQNVIRVMITELRDQNLFQGLFSLAAALLAWWLIPDPAMRQTTLIIIAGSFFQLLLMTVLNFLYYFELYQRALSGAAVFLALNALVFPLLQQSLPGLPLGLGYLASLVLATGFAYVLLRRAVGSIDQRILLKAML